MLVTNVSDVGGGNDNTVSVFGVDGSGNAAELAGSPYPAGSVPSSILTVTTTPTGGSGGLFVYVANSGTGSSADSVSVFQVCTIVNVNCTAQDVTDAKLQPVGAATAVGLNPVAMTVDPTNTFLYVANRVSSTISSFKINPGTGVLSGLNPSTVSTGAEPIALSMHSSGKFLFVSNNASSSVSAFVADVTTGALSTPTTVTSSTQPAGLVAK